MSWIFLILAGFMEILGVIVLKAYALSHKKIHLLGIAVFFIISLSFLGIALRELPAGLAYAIWTGIGTAGGVLAGIIFYGESKNPLKLFFITLILVCSVGLKFVSH